MVEIKEVDDATLAFPAQVIGAWLPLWEDIPDEFKKNKQTKWHKVFDDWFFFGLEEAAWYSKPGVDPRKALRHIQVCMGSFEPKQEHKSAGVAYLMSEWFDDVEYKVKKKNL